MISFTGRGILGELQARFDQLAPGPEHDRLQQSLNALIAALDDLPARAGAAAHDADAGTVEQVIAFEMVPIIAAIDALLAELRQETRQ